SSARGDSARRGGRRSCRSRHKVFGIRDEGEARKDARVYNPGWRDKACESLTGHVDRLRRENERPGTPTRERQPMRFQVSRSSQGAVSKKPPCKGAIRGPEAAAWPGEYTWFIELNGLEEF